MIDIDELINLSQVLDMYDYYLGTKGRNGRYKCPFNPQESNHNISVKNGIWHCFSCGTGGNIVQLVKKMYGISFKEAIKKICSDFKLDNLLNPSKETLEQIELRKLQRQIDKRNHEKFENEKKVIFQKLIEQEKILDILIEYLEPQKLDEWSEMQKTLYSYSAKLQELFDYLKLRDIVDTMINILSCQEIKESFNNAELLHKIDYSCFSKDDKKKSEDKLTRLILKGEITIKLYE